MNEAVHFTFYPVGGFTNAGINKSVACPPSSGSNSGSALGDLPDPHCQGDKYEACLMNASSCVDDTCPQKIQLALSAFLDCFEGQHGSDMTKAPVCAAGAGFDIQKIQSCYHDAALRAAVWKSLQDRTASKRATLTCFPWVEVNGKALTDDCFGPNARTWPLLKALCSHFKAEGMEAPAACKGESIVV